MRGALNAMLRLRRLTLSMYVGSTIPPVQIRRERPRKQQLQDAADRIVNAIWALIPEEEHPRRSGIRDETFELIVEIQDQDGGAISPPANLSLEHGPALSKFIHRTTLFNNLLENLRQPISALRDLHLEPSIAEILRATEAIVQYLERENPFYFTYRYGPS